MLFSFSNVELIFDDYLRDFNIEISMFLEKKNIYIFYTLLKETNLLLRSVFMLTF